MGERKHGLYVSEFQIPMRGNENRFSRGSLISWYCFKSP